MGQDIISCYYPLSYIIDRCPLHILKFHVAASVGFRVSGLRFWDQVPSCRDTRVHKACVNSLPALDKIHYGVVYGVNDLDCPSQYGIRRKHLEHKVHATYLGHLSGLTPSGFPFIASKKKLYSDVPKLCVFPVFSHSNFDVIQTAHLMG